MLIYFRFVPQNLVYSSRYAGEVAGVAQLVEQLICNQPVGGSNPSASSKSPEIERNRGFLFPILGDLAENLIFMKDHYPYITLIMAGYLQLKEIFEAKTIFS